MRARLILLSLLTGLLAGSALAQSGVSAFKASAPLNLELKNAQWFEGQAFRRGTLYVSDGLFVEHRPRRIHRSMDLKKQFLIAPLADAHNYNLQNGWGVDHYAQRYLQDGVFYAAMLCAAPADVEAVRSRLNQADSPDVRFATACITSSDGQPLANLLAAPPGAIGPRLEDVADKAVLLMDSPAQVAQKWPLVGERSSDLVQLVLSYHERPELRGRPELQGRLGLEASTAAEVVRHAHQAGLRVSAHVDSVSDFEAALQIGVDQVAQLPGYFNHHGDAPEQYLISEAAAARAARQGMAVVTATAATGLFNPEPELLQRLRQVQALNLQRLKAAGVPLLLGSDMFTATALVELRQLASLGVFSRAELLKMASIDTPRALFPQRRLGCFEPGCEASFLLLAADPLLDIEAVSQPLLRVKKGRLLTLMGDVAEASEASSDSAEPGPARKKVAKAKPKSRSAAKKR